MLGTIGRIEIGHSTGWCRGAAVLGNSAALGVNVEGVQTVQVFSRGVNLSVRQISRKVLGNGLMPQVFCKCFLRS